MNKSKDIKVNRLLRLREELFENVLDSEVAIEEAFGSKKIIPLPPELPSIFKKNKIKYKPKAKSITIRRLNAKEDCFRVLFTLNGEDREDFIQEVRLVRRLAELNISTLILKKIETVNLLDSGEVEPLELIFFNRDFLKR